MKTTKVYITVSIELQSKYDINDELIEEFQQNCDYSFISATPFVDVISTEMVSISNTHPDN